MTKQAGLVMLLAGIFGVLAVTALPGRGQRPAAMAAEIARTEPVSPAHAVVALAEARPEPDRVSFSFTDKASESIALRRGDRSERHPAQRTDLNLWYGQYSERDYRPLPASPFEREPSRLNVRLSIAF